MNVRDYMHEISSQNINTLSSNEEGLEGKRKMSKEEALTEQQNKNKVRADIRSAYCRICRILLRLYSSAVCWSEPFIQ